MHDHRSRTNAVRGLVEVKTDRRANVAIHRERTAAVAAVISS
ncbi:MAG TPA: hypothetical protein VNT92_12730 [Acidimicrobiia bacterium]|nr:hypothetical protein [Acidimicrobiia bacterium]